MISSDFFKRHIAVFVLTSLYGILAFYNLGSFRVPETYWAPKPAEVSDIVDLGGVKRIHRILYYFGLGKGEIDVQFSIDAKKWENSVRITQKTIFENLEWRSLQINYSARYIRFLALDGQVRLHEVAFFDDLGVEIKIDPNLAPDAGKEIIKLFDEPHKIDPDPSFLSGMYMDEDYHARAAIEQMESTFPSESTHPPLGKVIIGLGIRIFGQNAFGWRSMGTIFGILMIPAIYLLGLALFKNSALAFLGSFLLSFDFMHFTQTRIAAVDSFATFFCLIMFYFMVLFYLGHRFLLGRNKLLLLFGSGLSFGLGIATKWSVAYGGIGLAILFFLAVLSSENTNWKFLARYFLYGIVFFIILPFSVYFLSYFQFFRMAGISFGWSEFLNQQRYMFNFHHSVNEIHPFASKWWEWPLILRPIWYYTRKFGEGQVNNIVAMGNPMIWWAGFVAVPLNFFKLWKEKSQLSLILLVMGFSLYLPWAMGIRTVTFIYHFCTVSPFWILMIVTLFKRSDDNSSYSNLIYFYMAVVLLFFILFYPVISGFPTSSEYQTALRWLPSWYW